MSPEMTPDMEWARKKLESQRYGDVYWDRFLQAAAENISGLHEQTALILIAKGLEKRPIGKVIERLKKEGGKGLGTIDSARDK